MDLKHYVRAQIQKCLDVKQAIYQDEAFLSQTMIVSQRLTEVLKKGNKLLIGGNGGSAADSQHIAAEFVSRFYFDRPGLPAIALTTDTSILTAIGNDYGFNNLFARQVQAHGKAGDMFIAISTSGNSPNIIKALEQCRDMGIITVGFTGVNGGEMVELCDHCFRVPSIETPRIQEAHIMIGHIICAVVEQEIFGSGF